jgi:hypothetical protein
VTTRPWHLVLIVAAPLLLPLGGCGSAHGPRSTAHAPSFPGLLRAHLTRYPLAEAEDVYKFTHQSVYGPAHAVPSRDEAGRYLEEELASLSAGPADEPLVDALSDDPPLARLNLRPYVAAGGDREALLDAFVTTAAEVHGSADLMAERLDTAVAVLSSLGREETARQLAILAADRIAAGYPAAHHSENYRKAYRPAYRVVRPALIGPTLRRLHSPPGGR